MNAFILWECSVFGSCSLSVFLDCDLNQWRNRLVWVFLDERKTFTEGSFKNRFKLLRFCFNFRWEVLFNQQIVQIILVRGNTDFLPVVEIEIFDNRSHVIISWDIISDYWRFLLCSSSWLSCEFHLLFLELLSCWLVILLFRGESWHCCFFFHRRELSFRTIHWGECSCRSLLLRLLSWLLFVRFSAVASALGFRLLELLRLLLSWSIAARFLSWVERAIVIVVFFVAWGVIVSLIEWTLLSVVSRSTGLLVTRFRVEWESREEHLYLFVFLRCFDWLIDWIGERLVAFVSWVDQVFSAN